MTTRNETINSEWITPIRIRNKKIITAVCMVCLCIVQSLRVSLYAGELKIDGSLTVEEDTNLQGPTLSIAGGFVGTDTSVAIFGGATNNAFAFGIFSYATGESSTAFGTLCSATAENSRVFGSDSYVTGKFATAMGSSVSASADNSVAIGRGLGAKSFASIVLGSDNPGFDYFYEGGNPLAWVELDDLFILGNGGLSNAITTLKNGQTKLTNKAWKAETSDGTIEEDEVPTDSVNSSNGRALVVEGHANFLGNLKLTNGSIRVVKPTDDIPMFGATP